MTKREAEKRIEICDRIGGFAMVKLRREPAIKNGGRCRVNTIQCRKCIGIALQEQDWHDAYKGENKLESTEMLNDQITIMKILFVQYTRPSIQQLQFNELIVHFK